MQNDREESLSRSNRLVLTKKLPEEVFGRGENPDQIRRIEGRQYDRRAMSERRDQPKSESTTVNTKEM